MLRTIHEVESFEHKLAKMFEEVTSTESDLFDMHVMGKKIGLSDSDIESMYWHLKRGDILEKDNGSGLVRFSGYGIMLQTGAIMEACVPEL